MCIQLSFKFWNFNIHKEIYNNLKKIFISLYDISKRQTTTNSINNKIIIKTFNYNSDAFKISSIEYKINYIIEYIAIEKIIFTS